MRVLDHAAYCTKARAASISSACPPASTEWPETPRCFCRRRGAASRTSRIFQRALRQPHASAPMPSARRPARSAQSSTLSFFPRRFSAGTSAIVQHNFDRRRRKLPHLFLVPPNAKALESSFDKKRGNAPSGPLPIGLEKIMKTPATLPLVTQVFVPFRRSHSHTSRHAFGFPQHPNRLAAQSSKTREDFARGHAAQIFFFCASLQSRAAALAPPNWSRPAKVAIAASNARELLPASRHKK